MEITPREGAISLRGVLDTLWSSTRVNVAGNRPKGRLTNFQVGPETTNRPERTRATPCRRFRPMGRREGSPRRRRLGPGERVSDLPHFNCCFYICVEHFKLHFVSARRLLRALPTKERFRVRIEMSSGAPIKIGKPENIDPNLWYIRGKAYDLSTFLDRRTSLPVSPSSPSPLTRRSSQIPAEETFSPCPRASRTRLRCLSRTTPLGTWTTSTRPSKSTESSRRRLGVDQRFRRRRGLFGASGGEPAVHLHQGRLLRHPAYSSQSPLRRALGERLGDEED